MYKLFEEKKEELKKTSKKEYKQFDKQKLYHEKEQKDDILQKEKEIEIEKIFNDFNIKINISKKINSFQTMYFEITPESKEELKKMMRNKKLLEYYLQTEIRKEQGVFIIEYTISCNIL